MRGGKKVSEDSKYSEGKFRGRLHILLIYSQCNCSSWKRADCNDLVGLTDDHGFFLLTVKTRPPQHKAESFIGVREECHLLS